MDIKLAFPEVGWGKIVNEPHPDRNYLHVNRQASFAFPSLVYNLQSCKITPRQ